MNVLPPKEGTATHPRKDPSAVGAVELANFACTLVVVVRHVKGCSFLTAAVLQGSTERHCSSGGTRFICGVIVEASKTGWFLGGAEADWPYFLCPDHQNHVFWGILPEKSEIY